MGRLPKTPDRRQGHSPSKKMFTIPPPPTLDDMGLTATTRQQLLEMVDTFICSQPNPRRDELERLLDEGHPVQVGTPRGFPAGVWFEIGIAGTPLFRASRLAIEGNGKVYPL